MHFAVAVICDRDKTIEELLAPYQENNMCNVDKKYLEFFDIEVDYRHEYESDIVRRVVMPDGRLLSPHDEEFRVAGCVGFGQDSFVVPTYLEIKDFRLTELYKTFDSYMQDFLEIERDPETGKYGYWDNPNAKWDWYVIGGRFRGQVRAQHGLISPELGLWTYIKRDTKYPSGHFDSACLGDLIWNQDDSLAEEAELRYSEILSKASPLNKIMRFDKFNNVEEYVYCKSHMWFGSVVTPDGLWHELGFLGVPPHGAPAGECYKWAKSFKERFVDPYPDDYTLSVVDCHI